jgi:abortive infection bacteriophage resistance protein
MPPHLTFNKPTITGAQQIALLKQRGLVIDDEARAAHYLKFIGYYRFSGYLLPLKADADHFKSDANFEQALDLYIFDRKLRLLTFDAIERIEVALRATITRVMSEAQGAHWFMKPEIFVNRQAFSIVDRNIRESTLESNPRKRDVFIRHYYDTYAAPELPPSWMVFETLSMGSVSYTLKLLRLDLRKAIARDFNVDEVILISWIHALIYTRNLCAHHARLWNRVFTIKPKAMKRHKSLMTPTDNFHAQALAVEILLRAIAPDSHWSKKLTELFVEHPSVDIAAMGFTKNWSGFSF